MTAHHSRRDGDVEHVDRTLSTLVSVPRRIVPAALQASSAGAAPTGELVGYSPEVA